MSYQRPLYENSRVEVDVTRRPATSIEEIDLQATRSDLGFLPILNALAGRKGR
ncbi:MAG: hypothetical protein AAGA81_23120 [Acidobacteriota bacterium]